MEEIYKIINCVYAGHVWQSSTRHKSLATFLLPVKPKQNMHKVHDKDENAQNCIKEDKMTNVGLYWPRQNEFGQNSQHKED